MIESTQADYDKAQGIIGHMKNHLSVKGISLLPVTSDNWRECIGLSVFDEQRDFVASNVFSIAQSKVDTSMVPMCMYSNDEMVGFCMYGKDPEDGRVWIVRFMIDKAYQKQGLGKKTLEILIHTVCAEYNPKEIFLSFEPGNEVAKKLYMTFGFCDTGEIEDNELVYKLEVVSNDRE